MPNASTPSHTPTWPRTTISGALRVYVAPCTALDAHQAATLWAVVACFLDALRLEMFPGTLGIIRDLRRGNDGKVDVCFDVGELHVGTLRVLHGMLTRFATNVAPLGTMIAWCEPVGSTPNLFEAETPPPAHRGLLGFDATFTFGRVGYMVPLVVEVTFGRTLIAEEKARLDAEIRVWAALIQGGYPKPGALPGSSFLGAFTVDYEDGHTLRLSTREFFADAACLEPLKALVVGWSKSIPVVSLETA